MLQRLADNFNIYLSPLEQIALRNVIFRRGAKVGALSQDDVESPVVNLRSPESAMRFFLQKTTSEDLKQKQKNLMSRQPVYFDEIVFLDEQSYRANYRDFMIKKSSFIRVVMSEWERFIDKKALHLEQAMRADDQYLRRQALNFD